MANASLNFTQGNMSFNVTPIELPSFMEKVLFGNTMKEYVIALILFLGAVALMKLIAVILIKILEKIDKKHPTQAKEIIVNVLKALHIPLFIMIALKISAKVLDTPVFIDKFLKYLMLIVLTYYSIKVINAVIMHSSRRIIEKREKEYKDNDKTLATFLTTTLKVIVWIAGLLFLLSSFGVNVSKVFTGLGIAGIAVAFALQSILGDIFAAISIYFDKPFKPGDYIMFDKYEGNVIKTGIKSTRIKLLRGEELVVSNKLLIDSKVQNIDQMQTRRVDVDLQIKYGTPRAKLEKLPGMLKEIVNKHNKNVNFNRCHLKAFKDYSIEFELIYTIKKSDYELFMDIQQKINLDILELLEKEGIEFAFPTQTINVEK